jgi:uncharacterized protein with HEPN domain
MKPEQKKYFFDMIESIGFIDSYLVTCASINEFISNPILVDAVNRRLAIIGEALFKANKMESITTLSFKTKIIGLRHVLVLDYDKINDETIWLICKTTPLN